MFNYRILDIHPAFGYEYYPTWCTAIDQNEKQAKDLANKNLQLGEDQPTMDTSSEIISFREGGGHRFFANNLSKSISYIPILSLIVGIARVALAGYFYIRRKPVFDHSSPIHYLQLQRNQVKLKHIARGITEIALGAFSLGYLLLIPDLIQTALYIKAAKEHDSSNQDQAVGTCGAYHSFLTNLRKV